MKIKAIFNKPLPRLLSLGVGLLVIYYLVKSIIFTINALLLPDEAINLGDIFLPINLSSGALVCLVTLYLVFTGFNIFWVLYSKNKSLKKFVLDTMPFVLIWALLLVWGKAAGFEYSMSSQWSRNPTLSWQAMNAIYIKAIAATAVLTSVYWSIWVALNSSNRKKQQD